MPATQPVKMFPPGPRELLKSTPPRFALFEDTLRTTTTALPISAPHQNLSRDASPQSADDPKASPPSPLNCPALRVTQINENGLCLDPQKSSD